MCETRQVSNHHCLWWQSLYFTSPGTLRMPSCCQPSASKSNHAWLAPSHHNSVQWGYCTGAAGGAASPTTALAPELTASLSLITERLSKSQKPLMAKKIITNLEKNMFVSIYWRKIFKYHQRMYNNNDRMPKSGFFELGVCLVQALEEIGQFWFEEHFVLKRKNSFSLYHQLAEQWDVLFQWILSLRALVTEVIFYLIPSTNK